MPVYPVKLPDLHCCSFIEFVNSFNSSCRYDRSPIAVTRQPWSGPTFTTSPAMRFLAWLDQYIQFVGLEMSEIQCFVPKSDGKPEVFDIIYLGNTGTITKKLDLEYVDTVEWPRHKLVGFIFHCSSTRLPHHLNPSRDLRSYDSH